MKKHRLVLSDVAAVDIVEQADWYSAQSGKALAARWGYTVTSVETFADLMRLTN